MAKEDYLHQIMLLLKKEGIRLSLQVQILETVDELLDYYTVEFVQTLLPTLFQVE